MAQFTSRYTHAVEHNILLCYILFLHIIIVKFIVYTRNSNIINRRYRFRYIIQQNEIAVIGYEIFFLVFMRSYLFLPKYE